MAGVTEFIFKNANQEVTKMLKLFTNVVTGRTYDENGENTKLVFLKTNDLKEVTYVAE